VSAKLGIPYKKAGNTALIATLKGKESGKTIALRGDIDDVMLLCFLVPPKFYLK